MGSILHMVSILSERVFKVICNGTMHCHLLEAEVRKNTWEVQRKQLRESATSNSRREKCLAWGLYRAGAALGCGMWNQGGQLGE